MKSHMLQFPLIGVIPAQHGYIAQADFGDVHAVIRFGFTACISFIVLNRQRGNRAENAHDLPKGYQLCFWDDRTDFIGILPVEINNLIPVYNPA